MKKIKLFKNYTEEIYESELLDFIYESWIKENPSHLDILNEEGENEEDPEEDNYIDDSELTPGELRALKRDLQVISRGQLAALYLKALGRYEFSEDKGEDEKSIGRSTAERVSQDVYITGVKGIEPFCNEDWRTGNLYIGPSGLSDAIGIRSKGTITRTVNKFYLLLKYGAGNYEEVVYPKVIKAYEFYKDKSIQFIQDIAEKAIEDPTTSNYHRSTLSKKGITKEQSIAIGKNVYSIMQDLLKAENPKTKQLLFNRDICKVQKMAVNKVSGLKKLTYDEVKSFYKDYLVKNRMLDKFNWCNNA
jgi:hypothetical protein